MKELFSIGEVSKLFSMNLRTLRYYDEIHLLPPEYIDKNTGYRYYSAAQFERLNTIRYLRALHMPIAKIRDFFDNKDPAQLMALLKEQQEMIRRQKAELELIHKKICNRLEQLEDALETVYGEILEKHIPVRRIAFLRREIRPGDNLEYPIRELEISSRLDSEIFLGKVGLSVSRENLLSRNFQHFSRIFVVLEGERPAAGHSGEIPESDYLTIRFKGTHQESGTYYLLLLQYMEEHHYRLSGDSVEITLIDYGITGDLEEFVTELQIPFTPDSDSFPQSFQQNY